MTSTGDLIAETATKILKLHAYTTAMTAAEGDWNDKLWGALCNAELTSVWTPASDDIAPEDALQIPRLAGQYSAAVPLVENLLATYLARAAQLDPLAEPRTVAPVNLEDRIVATESGGRWRVSGTATRVPWGRFANSFVVVVESESGPRVVVVPRSAAQIVREGENVAREPRDDVAFAGEVPSAPVVFEGGRDRLFALGAGMRVLQMAGALDSVVQLTVRHVREREQFGRPLAQFQAIQHNLAIMAANAAAASAAANSIVPSLAADGGTLAIAAAKLRAGEAASTVSALSHQMHGAMGFTQEHGLHFLMKRLWSWRDELGSETYWSRVLGTAACERGPERLWSFITTDF